MARFLLLVSGRMYGGGQRVVLDLMEEVGKTGQSISLCFLGEPIARMPCVSAEVVEYDGRYNRPITLVGAGRRVRKVIKRIKPELVHSHGWDASMIASLALRDSAVPHLIHIHTTDAWLESITLKQRLRRLLSRWMLQQPATHVVTVSEAVRRHWSYWVGLPMGGVVIRNGVDIRRFCPSSTQKSSNMATLGVAARLQPNKGLDDLFDAMAALEKNNIRPRLLIAGDGGMRDGLEGRAERLGLIRQVAFLGFIQDTSEFYRQIDICVLPSRSDEGLPLSVLEAMATALPVVATDVGGTAEVVRSGIDGFVVPARDPESLANALRVLLEDRARRKEMGANARRRVESEFSRTRFSEEVFSLYREILHQPVVAG